MLPSQAVSGGIKGCITSSLLRYLLRSRDLPFLSLLCVWWLIEWIVAFKQIFKFGYGFISIDTFYFYRFIDNAWLSLKLTFLDQKIDVVVPWKPEPNTNPSYKNTVLSQWPLFLTQELHFVWNVVKNMLRMLFYWLNSTCHLLNRVQVYPNFSILSFFYL